MVRLLLVANKTLASGEISEFVRDRMTKEECEFTLLVPATPRWDQEQGTRFVNGMASGSEGISASPGGEDNYAYGRSRLEFGLGILRGLGATADGLVGDPNPAKAINEILKRRQFDEVALSTLPKGVSRWLGLDIPRQVERKFHIPVTVIKVQSGASQ